MTLESREGEGSRFTVTIPWSEAEAAAPSRPRGGQAAVGQPLFGRILLVEDNEQNVRTYASYLRYKGYEVRVARNGREALEAVGVQRPQLVLMDVQMPGMDGLEATRQIRASTGDRSDVPIVALTALAMRGDAERCLEAGMDAYLSKPVQLAQLIATIEEHIDRS